MGERNSKQIAAQVVEEKKKLFDLSMKNSMGQLGDTSQIRKTRRLIARLMTAASQRNGETK